MKTRLAQGVAAILGIAVAAAGAVGAAQQRAPRPQSAAVDARETPWAASRTLMEGTDERILEFDYAAAVPKAVGSSRANAVRGSSTTLWSFDAFPGIARSVALGDTHAWSAWQDGSIPTGAGLRPHLIAGDGTPEFRFLSFDRGWTGVVSSKGADRVLFLESTQVLDEFRLHAFTSATEGMPEWSFEFPPTTTTYPANHRDIALSHDGTTAAAVSPDTGASDSTLYVFDAETGAVIGTWSDSTLMHGVELTDDGSLAMVTQNDQATVLDTATGEVVFQTEASGGGSSVEHRISGDGEVLVVAGFDLHVYRHDGSAYQRIIDFSSPNAWFGNASVVSRDGSTVGAMAHVSPGYVETRIYLFDVATGEMIGSHSMFGSGAYQGVASDAAASDDGSVITFASWGTQFQDWPEVMVFNREAELIGAIEIAGSAYAVDVSADGQYVVAGSKTAHANVPDNGGSATLIEIVPGQNPIPLLTELDPSSAIVGTQGVTLTVSGTGFRQGSVVRYDGEDRPTTYVDTRTLTAEIPASDLDTAGEFPVTVVTPAPGGGTSGPLDFPVLHGVPPPALDVNPESVAVTLPAGATTTEELTVSNLGGESLEWQVTEEDGARRSSGDPVTLTHSESLDILEDHSVACSGDDGQTTSPTQYLRAFDLEDFGILGDLDVTEVSFGVMSLTDPEAITVNLYTLDGELVYDNLTQIGTATEQLSAQELTLATVPVTGTAPAASTLVVEIVAPDLSGVGAFFPGANDLGETAPSYFASSPCGLLNPTPFAEIGFPDIHLVMAVSGIPGPLGCPLPDWISVDPSSGSVSGGSDQTVDLLFAAGTLAPGDYETNLCLDSNDPQQPLTLVPLGLSVMAAPVLELDPSVLDFGEVEGGSTGGPLTATLANAGSLEATSLSFGLPSAPFTADTSACGASLPAGASCSIDVTFTPTEAGPATAGVLVTSDGEAAASLSLEGSGVGEPVLTPAALEVDPHELVSNGNNVLEPDELVDVVPAWRNDGNVAVSLTGTATNLDGPGGNLYSLTRGDADYGLVESGAPASCQDVGVCYRLAIGDPAVRPARHWTVTFDETLSDPEGTSQTWTLHIGDSFLDVPRTSLFYQSIETLLHYGVTGGCTAIEYCPAGANTRGQMPVFLLRAVEGKDYLPPACEADETRFEDVPAGSPFCPWIEELARRSVVSGCGAGVYCPDDPVTRAQMAIFLLKTLEGPDYVPPPCEERFADLPCSSPFAPWAEDLFDRAITGGCGVTPPMYCPHQAVSRQQMAVFLTRTFELALYGP